MISDVHGFQDQLRIPKYDIVICSGDISNYRNLETNENEVWQFLHWFSGLPGIKILTAGNHDTSIEKGLVTREHIENLGIHYLEHEYKEIEGLKIFGSPYTKAFGQGWAFNVRPDRLHDYWAVIPEELDILITHGPPKQILDVSLSPDGYLEYCGDEALRKAVLSRNIRYHQFGHIHNCKGVYNAGMRRVDNIETIFVNAACVTDGRFDLGITSHGQVVEI